MKAEHFEQSMNKAKEYFETNRGKAMKANEWCDVGLLHYDIMEGSAIQLHHILSLILYTDNSKYCSAFSSTFRKLEPTQSFSAVKRRNSAFYWQSRYLRETVELFGPFGYDPDDETGESGPFYSGCSVVLPIPQFAMRLSGPTSTTKQIEVALNFTGDGQGMLLRLNNTAHSSST